MTEIQAFIKGMLDDAIQGWSDGTETPLFPKEEAGTTPVGLLLNASLNAMAYGYEHGLEKGYQMAKEASPGDLSRGFVFRGAA